MTETMVKQEVLFYKNSDDVRIDIDLMENIEGERLVMHSATAAQIIQVLNLFDSQMCSALHSGEIEALAVIHLKREVDGLFFCTGDAKAIEALVLMGLRSKGISLEHLLSKAGCTKKLPRHFSEIRFHELIEKASANKIQGIGLQ
ncbi:MAG: hypothetical protein K8S62_10040 [Candidatus Sabulitectum sp.]|nr:hypothetical protein [Candidatus Sabulitectum sp.]